MGGGWVREFVGGKVTRDQEKNWVGFMIRTDGVLFNVYYNV